MNIDTYRLPPQKLPDRVAASETVKSGDREASLADSRSFSDEEGENRQKEEKDIEQRVQEIEKRLVALNLRMATAGLNVRYTYSVNRKRIEITVRDAMTGEAIRKISENELDKVELRLAEMSGLLIDYDL